VFVELIIGQQILEAAVSVLQRGGVRDLESESNILDRRGPVPCPLVAQENVQSGVGVGDAG